MVDYNFLEVPQRLSKQRRPNMIKKYHFKAQAQAISISKFQMLLYEIRSK